VEEYFEGLSAERRDRPGLPPITASLKGILKGRAVSESDYWTHLRGEHA
jgi:hypothetical protein